MSTAEVFRRQGGSEREDVTSRASGCPVVPNGQAHGGKSREGDRAEAGGAGGESKCNRKRLGTQTRAVGGGARCPRRVLPGTRTHRCMPRPNPGRVTDNRGGNQKCHLKDRFGRANIHSDAQPKTASRTVPTAEMPWRGCGSTRAWGSKPSGAAATVRLICWGGRSAWGSCWLPLFIATRVQTSYIHFLYLFHPGEDSYEVSRFRDERVEFREVQCHARALPAAKGRAGTQTRASLMSLSPPTAVLRQD